MSPRLPTRALGLHLALRPLSHRAGPSIETTFECWTATATLARDTNRVNIGQMVGCNGYRNPALYAKIASTVDVASHGRLYAGIGAGWYEHEWRAYGYEWPETAGPDGALQRGLEIIYTMWTEDEPRFKGKYYPIDKPINEPKGVRNRTRRSGSVAAARR